VTDVAGVDDVKERVRQQLCEWLGSVTDDGTCFVVDGEKVRTIVAVEADDDAHAVIRVHSVTNWGLSASPELYRYAATDGGAAAAPCALRVVERDDGRCNVAVSYTLLGESVDPAELVSSVRNVASAAGDLAVAVQARFGGALTWD